LPTDPGLAIEILKKWGGIDHMVIADIGARGGAHQRWTQFAPILKVVGFELDSEECTRVNESAMSLPYSFHCFPYALGRSDGEIATLNITRQPGCTSLYVPNTALVGEFHYGKSLDVVGTQTVAVTSLDTICRKERFFPDYLKIDVQGAVLDVLTGAESILQRVLALDVEVEFSPLYVGQPLFSDLDVYMKERGFTLLGIRRTFWRRNHGKESLRTPFGGQIIHGDVLYINSNVINPNGDARGEDVLKLCAILSAYRQDDLVVYLLSGSHQALAEIPEAERLSLASGLVHRPSLVTNALRNVLRLMNKLSPVRLNNTRLRALVDALQEPSATDWHDPDFF